MDVTAPSSRLMTRLRTGFRKQGGFSVPAATGPSASLTLQDQLDTLDQVLTQVEQSKTPHFDPSAQVIPHVVDQATDTLNVPYGRSTAKETLGATAPVETATGLQYVEEEKVPEIPVEVESYLQKVEHQEISLPNEIVIADQTQTPMASHYAKQPVIVLPITPDVEAVGAKQNPFHSIRWLVEWSRKIMKMFNGKVIYREVN